MDDLPDDLPPTPYNMATYGDTHVLDGMRLVLRSKASKHLTPTCRRVEIDGIDISPGVSLFPRISAPYEWFGTVVDARAKFHISEHWTVAEIRTALWREGLVSLDGVLFHRPEHAIRARTAYLAALSRKR